MRKLKLTEKDVEKFILKLENDERSKNTIEKYVRDLRKLISFLDGQEITKERMLLFKKSLIEKYQPSAVNSILAAISTFFKYNNLDKFIVKRLKYQREVFRPQEKELTKTEYSRLVSTAEKIGNKRLSIIMQVICSTGIRVSELKFFTVDSIKRSRIEVSNKGKTRTIFISNQLKKLLSWYCKQNSITNGFIFKSTSGECVDRKTVWREMKKICIEANVSPTKVFPHNLRHLFALTYYQLKKDITRLADILGHSCIDTTRRYLVSTGIEHQNDINKMKLVLGYRT